MFGLPVRSRTASIAAASVLAVSLFAGSAALAGHMSDWNHDHSRDGVPPRPSGLWELNDVFGERCSNRANNARSWWPHSDTDPFGVGSYVEYHSYLARNIGFNVRNHINAAHRDGALYPGIGAYNCRLIDGSTTGRCTPGARPSTRTGSATSATRTTGTDAASTARTTARTSPTCGAEASRATGSSGG